MTGLLWRYYKPAVSVVSTPLSFDMPSPSRRSVGPRFSSGLGAEGHHEMAGWHVGASGMKKTKLEVLESNSTSACISPSKRHIQTRLQSKGQAQASCPTLLQGTCSVGVSHPPVLGGCAVVERVHHAVPLYQQMVPGQPEDQPGLFRVTYS